MKWIIVWLNHNYCYWFYSKFNLQLFPLHINTYNHLGGYVHYFHVFFLSCWRFNISKTELERRVNEPECLTKVDMISYVRLAKNTARTLLDDNEIKTNQHNKRSEHTVLSRMCESECQVLAQGVNDINFKYFPGSWFVKKSVQEMLMVDDDVATEEDYTTSRQRRKLVRDRIDQDEKTK